MTPQTMPSVGVLILVISLGWALVSALVFVLSIRMGTRPTAWVWGVSFVASSVVAAVFFWRLMRGEA